MDYLMGEWAAAEAGDRVLLGMSDPDQAPGFDAAALWRTWAADLEHRTTSAGHFMAEEAPADIIEIIRNLLAR